MLACASFSPCFPRTQHLFWQLPTFDSWVRHSSSRCMCIFHFSWLEMWMFPLYVLNLKVVVVKFMYALLNSTEALSFWIYLVVDFIWYIFIVYVYCMVYGLTEVNHSIGKLDSSESPMETLTIKALKFAHVLIFCDDVVQLQHHNLNWSLINHIFHNFRLSSIKICN